MSVDARLDDDIQGRYLDDLRAAASGLPFEVCSEEGVRGKFLRAAKELTAGSDLLEELPLICWPLPGPVCGPSAPSLAAGPAPRFCEGCLRKIRVITTTTTKTTATTATTATTTAGLGGPDSSDKAASDVTAALTPASGGGHNNNNSYNNDFCSEACAQGLMFKILSPEALQQLRVEDGRLHGHPEERPSSILTPEALARCVALILAGAVANLPAALQVAFSEVDEEELGGESSETKLSEALAACLSEVVRPFERLISVPGHISVDMGGAPGALGENEVPAWAQAVSEATRPGLQRFCREVLEPESGLAEAVMAALDEAVLDVGPLQTLGRALALNVQELTVGTNDIPAAGIFTFLACLNHSCDPNLQVVSSRPGSYILLRTLRTVAQGEELTINYTGAWDRPLKDRREQLQSRWLFTCKCPRCAAEDAMDKTREEIAALIRMSRSSRSQ
ncbi:unnamed protein product [Polarella glacialis]|uniref:SET domain-containing protein n=1 Tax=Polarella glacialis TaxID=89957 RepID=A0A813LM74_POLGL|nr:unnamed protein product [Polarella glacialis]